MKILYDHQIFTQQKYGGISRYFYELIMQFGTIDDTEASLPLIFSNNHYLFKTPSFNHFQFFPASHFKGKHRIMSAFNTPYAIHALKQQNFDLFHPTYYDPYFLNYLGTKPFVVTVYDMIHEKFKEMLPSRDKTSEHKELLVRKAAKIIAISESTKKDLIEIFGTEESKIDVIYLGNSMFPNEQITLDSNLPEKYILFVGSRYSYKNFDRFIRAVSRLLHEDSELSVICVGGGPFKTVERQTFDSLKIENQLHQYDLDDKKLALFYSNALLFVFPSLYEGFGIPVLEAFACKCPLVCSNTSSLPEIAGNGAHYFDPYDEGSICSAIKEVLEDKTLKKQLIQNGLERVKYFSWEKTALETRKTYESVLSESQHPLKSVVKSVHKQNGTLPSHGTVCRTYVITKEMSNE